MAARRVKKWKSREERKAELMAYFDQKAEELLDWQEQQGTTDLWAMEEKVEQVGRAVQGKMVETLVESQQRGLSVSETCPECGGRLEYWGERRRGLETSVGPVKVNRPYYYCRHCQVGFSPQDTALRQSRHPWSERLIERAIWLATHVPYRENVQALERFLGGHMSASSLGRLIREYGGQLQAAREEEASERAALPQRGIVVAGEQRETARRGIGVDGVLVHIRDEGWKEVKVAVVFEYERPPRRTQPAETTGSDPTEPIIISSQSYCAYLGDVESFEPLQWAEASRRHLPQAWEQVAISDGAEWIRRLYERNYGSATPVVDWYHAMEHVWTAGRLVCGEEGPYLTSWVKRREKALWTGQVHEVVRVIRAEATELSGEPQQKLLTEAAYFERNARRMQYQEFREDGLPIGSGMVEGGACKALVGDRLKGAGMRWSRPGAQAMLTLRAELFSQRWEQAWRLASPNFLN